jgi:hypothetical protein
MCTPAIAIGAAIGAATSAATGGDLQSIALGAVLGGATAGFGAPGGSDIFGSVFSSGITSNVGQFFGASTVLNSAIGMSAAQAVGMGAMGLGGGLLMGMMTPKTPDYGYTPAAQQVQYNSQNIATTGSGGRQATASLADAIKRSKKRKLTQEDVGDLSIDTGSFANTGLQLA